MVKCPSLGIFTFVSLGQILVKLDHFGAIMLFFFQIFTLVTCLKYSPIIAKNFRKIFRADSENRANEVFEPKMGQKRPSLT